MAVRTRIRWLIFATGGIVSLLSARCSLVTSLDGLTGGRTDAGDGALSTAASGSDATSPAEASDARIDPPRGDAAPKPPPRPGDAGTEDGGTLLFADDFEGLEPYPRQWDTMATKGGALARDTSLFGSPTSSLRATTLGLEAGAPGDAVNVTLRKAFVIPRAGSTVAYDFRVFPKQYDRGNSANAVLGALQIVDGIGDLSELQLDVRFDSQGASTTLFAEYTGLGDGGSIYLAHAVPGSFPVETWTRVRIELTLSQPPIARLLYDGALQLETSIAIPIKGTAIQISLGPSYASAPSDPWVIHYDDAAFWVLR